MNRFSHRPRSVGFAQPDAFFPALLFALLLGAPETAHGPTKRSSFRIQSMTSPPLRLFGIPYSVLLLHTVHWLRQIEWLDRP